MQGTAEFRQLLEDGDAGGLWRAWGRVAPHLPQPKSLEDAEITMHMARTATRSIPVSAQLYSHRWLTERGLPSQLPGDMLPKIVEAVGIAVSFKSSILAPAAAELQKSMSDAVEDCYANSETAVPFVRARMGEARDRTLKALFGRSARG